jgi:diacylglycerol kinase (ATP)
VAGLGALSRYRPVRVTLGCDGAALDARLTQVFVANLPRYAFALRVAPEADPADGLLDVVAVGPMGRLAVGRLLLQLRHGAHLARPDVRAERARRVRIATDGSSPIIADAVNLGAGPVELSVETGALSIVAPPR